MPNDPADAVSRQPTGIRKPTENSTTLEDHLRTVELPAKDAQANTMYVVAKTRPPNFTGRPLASRRPNVSLNAPGKQFDHSLVQRARRR